MARKNRTELVADNNGTKITVIPAAALFVDPLYQRISEGSKRAKRISTKFKWKNVHTFLVSPRPNGRFACVDGGHRFHAIALRYPGFVRVNGKPINLRCEVLPPSKRDSKGRYTDEALSFLGAQDEQRAPNANDAFKALRYTGDSKAVSAFNLARAKGITIRFREPGKRFVLGDNETRHGGVFYWARLKLGTKGYKFLLSLLTRFTYDGSMIETKALQGAFIRGMTRFLTSTDMTESKIERGLKNALNRDGVSATLIVNKAHKKIRSGFQREQVVSDIIERAIHLGLLRHAA